MENDNLQLRQCTHDHLESISYCDLDTNSAITIAIFPMHASVT